MKPAALIFDVDGTLADTEEAHRCAFNLAFDQLGLDWNWSKPTYAHLLLTAGGKERIGTYIASLDLDPAERPALQARIGEIHRTKTEHFTRMVLTGEVPLRDGVLRLIDEAARLGVRIGIASTTTYANIDALLRTHLGPAAVERFAVIGAAHNAEHKKPAPDIYRYVLERLSAPPGECVALEDSANGLRAAKAAGLYTVVTPSYWTRTEDFSAADLVLPSLGSKERPLPARAAALIGSDMLGIRELDSQLDAVRAGGPGTIHAFGEGTSWAVGKRR